jgi:predicted O-methyltransferase YrrM
MEIGTSVGLATAALAVANENAIIVSLEGCPETANVARTSLQSIAENVNVITTEFATFLTSLAVDKSTFDLIYFDGNHQKVATLRYFDLLLPTVTNDSVWIFDDIHWSRDMEDAWEEIKAHPKVTVTIDTFQWGIVFFRKEQRKEDFFVRV